MNESAGRPYYVEVMEALLALLDTTSTLASFCFPIFYFFIFSIKTLTLA